MVSLAAHMGICEGATVPQDGAAKATTSLTVGWRQATVDRSDLYENHRVHRTYSNGRRHRMRRSLAVLAVLCAGAPAAAQQSEADCTALRDTVFAGGYVTSARVIEAAETLPAYCEVRATALPAISIEVRLP